MLGYLSGLKSELIKINLKDTEPKVLNVLSSIDVQSSQLTNSSGPKATGARPAALSGGSLQLPQQLRQQVEGASARWKASRVNP